MSEKEKAQELVRKFKPLADWNNEYGSAEPKANHEKGKQCAIVAVGEIISAISDFSSELKHISDYEDATYKFWNNVRHEIEKL